jgi:hypothetical protein
VYLFAPISGGSPYDELQIAAWVSDGGSWVGFATYRFDPDSNSGEFFLWDSRVPRGSVGIANDLSKVSIHTGDALGTMGSIDLDLSASRHRKHHVGRCRATGERLRSSIASRVKMSGDVELSLGLAGVPDPVHASSARGAARRTRYTGAHCPRDERRCYPYAGFGAWDETAETAVTFNRWGDVDVIHEDVSWRHDFLAWITRFGWEDPSVSITHDTATLDGDLTSPFLDGSLTFVRTGLPKERMRGPCRFIHSRFGWSSGTLDVLWDTGAVSLVGPWDAQLYRWQRP